METAEWFAGFLEVRGPESTDGLNRFKLRELVELVQFADRLLGKGDLEHGGRAGESFCKLPVAATLSFPVIRFSGGLCADAPLQRA
jgi:hypothetical protein